MYGGKSTSLATNAVNGVPFLISASVPRRNNMNGPTTGISVAALGGFGLPSFVAVPVSRNFDAVDVEKMNFERDRARGADCARAVGIGDYSIYGSSLRDDDGISGGYIVCQNKR